MKTRADHRTDSSRSSIFKSLFLQPAPRCLTCLQRAGEKICMLRGEAPFRTASFANTLTERHSSVKSVELMTSHTFGSPPFFTSPLRNGVVRKRRRRS